MDSKELDARMREILGANDPSLQSDLKMLNEMRERMKKLDQPSKPEKEEIEEIKEGIQIVQKETTSMASDYPKEDNNNMVDTAKFATPENVNVSVSAVKVDVPTMPTIPNPQPVKTANVTITDPSAPAQPVQTMSVEGSPMMNMNPNANAPQSIQIPTVQQNPVPGVQAAPSLSQQLNPFAGQEMATMQMPVVTYTAKTKKNKDAIDYEALHKNLMANWKTMEKKDIFAIILTLISEGKEGRAISAKSVADSCGITPANRILQAINGKAMKADPTNKVIRYFWTNPILTSKYPDVLQILQPDFFGFKVASN